jgi:hypothetical protein
MYVGLVAAVGQLNQQLRMDIAGEVAVLGLAESPQRSGACSDGGGDNVRGEASEDQAATLIQANFRGNQLRRQLAAEDKDEEYHYQNEDQRTALVCHVLLSSLQYRPDQMKRDRAAKNRSHESFARIIRCSVCQSPFNGM